MLSDSMSIKITGDPKLLLSALEQSTAGLKSFAREVDSIGAGMGGMLKNLQAPILALAGLVGGGAFLAGTITETKDWAVEASKLSKTLGITTEQASVLNLAIGDIYGNMDEFLPVVAKLTKSLNANEDAFKKLGVATRDNQGHLRPTLSIMADVNTKLMEMKSGTDRNVASMQIYGKGWMDVQRYLGLTNEVMQAAQEKAEKLNLIVGGDSVAATKAYRESMNDLEDVVKSLKIRLGQELMPVMTQFNNAVSEEGPSALKVLGGALRGVYEILDGIWSGFKMFAVGLVGVIRAIYETAVAILNPIWGFLTEGIPGFKREWALANKDLTVHWQDTVNALNEIGDAYTTRQMTRWGELQAAQRKAVSLPGGGKTVETESGREAKDAEARVQKAIEGERMKHLQRMSAIESADILRGQEDRRKNNDWVIKEMEDMEKRKAEQAAKDQEQASKINGYSGEAGAVRALDEYLLKSQDQFQTWKDAVTNVLGGIQNAFSSTFSGILSGQMSFAEGLRNLWQGITQAIVGALAQMAAQWVTTQIVTVASEKAARKAQLTGELAGMTGAMGLAAAETWAAYAWIPYIGPALALAQIAAMDAAMAPMFASTTAAMAFAQGGVIDRPTLALIGEVPGSKEVVMPESTAREWLENLTANILGNEIQIRDYQSQSARNSSSASRQVLSASRDKRSSGSESTMHVDLRGAQILDSSQRGLRKLGSAVMDGVRSKAREVGVVLKPGRTFGVV